MYNLLFLFWFFIPMEITSELDLSPDHSLALLKHWVSELYTNCVLSTLLHIILVLVIRPYHSII
jgi:nucleoside recognition membrane protein YjiH